MAKAEDLTGQKFGAWVVKRRASCRELKWDCICDCGNLAVVWGGHLRSGASKSCGCLRNKLASERRLIDLTGKRFGRLTVKGRNPKNTRFKHPRWDCICDCGNVAVIQGEKLRNGETKSCGCLQREIAIMANTIHGNACRGKLSTEYSSWNALKNRCLNMNAEKWPNYGGRGIKICDRWIDSFENFLYDMGKRPEGCSSIDRKDNDGGYEPGNCRWATYKQQAGNTSKNVWIEHGGKRMIKADWIREVGVWAGTWNSMKNKHGFSEEETLEYFVKKLCTARADDWMIEAGSDSGSMTGVFRSAAG